MLEALKDHYDITLFHADGVDLAAVNRFYGTSLRPDNFRIISANPLVRAIGSLDSDRGSIQVLSYMMRVVRRIRHRYDLVLGTDDTDLGGSPALLYMHYPYLEDFWRKYQDSRVGLTGLVQGRTRPWVLLSGFSLDRFRQNVVLANSDWTGHRIADAYGVPSRTVYPPVTECPYSLPWKDREDAFVAVGMLTPNKRMDWIVETLASVKKAYPRLRIYLAGGVCERIGGHEFHGRLRAIVDTNRDWVTLHEDLSRDELLRLLGRCRYAIHAMHNEHFGIAPAEALMAGCIPFVHDSGGQVEIVGRDPRVCYQDDDAALRIQRVLGDAEIQRELRTSFANRRDRFTSTRFMREIRDAVALAMP